MRRGSKSVIRVVTFAWVMKVGSSFSGAPVSRTKGMFFEEVTERSRRLLKQVLEGTLDWELRE